MEVHPRPLCREGRDLAKLLLLVLRAPPAIEAYAMNKGKCGHARYTEHNAANPHNGPGKKYHPDTESESGGGAVNNDLLNRGVRRNT